MKEKIKNIWNKFKDFYKKHYEKNKILTIILTIIAIPILFALICIIGIVIFYLIIFILILWICKILFFGFGKGKNSTSFSSKVKEPSGISHYGYSMEEVLAMIDTYPSLKMNSAYWDKIAEALDESKHTDKIKVMYAGDLPIYIFPYDKKPRLNYHFLEENTVSSGGGWFEKAKEHFTAKELKNGEICIIYQEKRLIDKDIL